MFGILRNRVYVISKQLNLSRGAQVSTLNSKTSQASCQECNLTEYQTTGHHQLTIRLISAFKQLSSPLSPVAIGNSLGSSWMSGQSLDSSLSGGFLIQTRGLQYKGRVKRRCKDCSLRWVNGMLYNLCKTHPRHKHVLKPPYYANQRIMTHATSSPKRPW